MTKWERSLSSLVLSMLHCEPFSHLQKPISAAPFSCHTSLTYPQPRRYRSKNVVFGRKSVDPKESQFFDEDGAVDDMDGYMNYLSLEYDSVWDTKPSWCQPWTIALTGALVIAFSWLILHSVLATGVVVFIISLWWYIFLYSYPKAYADMIAERRKRVSNGVEDTFGLGETRRSNIIFTSTVLSVTLFSNSTRC